MTIALTTRGMLCHKSSRTLSLLSWGLLCFKPIGEVGFAIQPSLPECTYVFNKGYPQPLDPAGVVVSSLPQIQLTGRKSVSLGNPSPKLTSPIDVSLYTSTTVQLTGAKVVTTLGSNSLLLSKPLEPTLTSSGTKAPEVFDKDC